MTGAVRPACVAISVSEAWNGRPDGFPRGRAFTPRVETPWPKIGPASSARSCLRFNTFIVWSVAAVCSIMDPWACNEPHWTQNPENDGVHRGASSVCTTCHFQQTHRADYLQELCPL